MSQEARPFIKSSFTQQANRKNSITDWKVCPYCGNFNDAYRDGADPRACPQCSEQQHQTVDKAVGKTAKLMSVGTVSNLKSLQGRILTIIDGLFGDPTQRNAVKTLINKEFRHEIGKASRGSVYGGGE